MNSDEYSVMNNKDLEAEIHPLKNEDGKAPDNHENCAEKEGLCRKPTRLSQLSRWRTAAFFLSLFLCLIVVFAFSFIIPCPVRPVSQRTWNRKYDRAVTYEFLAIEDVNKDKVQDVIFVFKDTNGSSSFNRSCSDEGLSAPCVFVTAVSGTNGSTLWERPVTEDLLWMECAIEQLGGAQSPGCLVIGNPELLTAISPHTEEFPAYSTTESSLEILTVDAPGSLFTAPIQEILSPKGEQPSYFASSSPGEVQWRQFNSFGANYTVVTPLLKIPDVDGDGVQDVMIFTTAGDETQSFIYSGKKGEQIGTSGRLSLGARPGYLMHVTKAGSYYVLFNTVNSLYGYSLKDLYSMATGVESKLTSLKQDPQWEKKIKSPTLHIPLLSSGDIRYLVKVPGRSGENILVVKSDMAELLNGQTLDSLWTVNASHILREPVFGYYTPDVLHIVLESGVGPNMKKVMIVESGSGAVHWELELNSRAGSPRPATLNTADHRSIFLFWGEYQAQANETGSKAARQNLYLFHPSYPNVLLELNNSSDQIVAFDAVLFERSRHACYVLLTRPQSSEGPGWVSVAKQKLKEDIPGSRVIWLSQVAGDSEQYIRDRFFRMRFSSQM